MNIEELLNNFPHSNNPLKTTQIICNNEGNEEDKDQYFTTKQNTEGDTFIPDTRDTSDSKNFSRELSDLPLHRPSLNLVPYTGKHKNPPKTR